MQPHPFTESSNQKMLGALLLVVALVVHWWLLSEYGEVLPLPAAIDSIVSMGLLSVAGYYAWFVLAYIRVWQVQALLALLLQLVCLGVSFTLLALLGMEDTASFVKGLPLRCLFGLMGWAILLQWYSRMRDRAEKEEEVLPPAAKQVVEPLPAEIIEKISVKDGSRIHIVHIGELFCLQASGDYVTLFTPTGQYIKEQTMKYFETHLPPSFVRIHRSSIVNTEFILRVELFGKENYQVKLKNGTSLRASSAGYKLLKERLSL
ncbi:LytTR family transcriptional regulator [Parabacteroides sp. OttesenSCG-928-K15]|nr:LytTR family transcriptional regulator [Parabacteroides sp. OttesenSCG-928-K15]